MLTIQEITERLRNHYICSTAAAASQSLISNSKMRHRSEPATVALPERTHHERTPLPSSSVEGHLQSPVRSQLAIPQSAECDVASEGEDETLQQEAASPGSCPPSKRHCRSLSIPSDSYTSIDEWLAHHHLPRPVALRPLPKGAAFELHNGCLYTPSQSPVPRPASAASSGFYDGSSSSASSLYWAGSAVAATGASLDSLACAGMPRTRLLTGDAQSMQRSSSRCRTKVEHAPLVCPSGVQAAKSMPSVGGAEGAFSTPSSPKHSRPQRCRSQPCDLQRERSAGLKRRREDERPCLNFAKMTETAYERLADKFTRHKSFPLNVNHSYPHHQHPHHNVGSFLPHSMSTISCQQQDSIHVLQTIASSPLDSGCALSSSPAGVSSPWQRSAEPDCIADGAYEESSSSESADSEYVDASCEPFLGCMSPCDLDLDEIEQH